MAIIALTVSLRQALRGEWGPRPSCPTDPQHPLIRNGTFLRQAGNSEVPLRIQRYRCRPCAKTYSALPYDCRPYTSYLWPVVVAVGWIWPLEHRWTWRQCHRWLAENAMDVHQRTVERWAARWRAGNGPLLITAARWIAAHYGTRRVPVWHTEGETPLQHWRALWRGVVQVERAAGNPQAAVGGWLAGSVLWGWLPSTFFAGLAGPTERRTLTVEVKRCR